MRCWLLLGWALCGAVAAAPRATIELLPQARVGTDSVTLGQVARLWSPDLELMRTLVDLPIGRAPRAGQPALVQRDALARWTQQRAAVAEGELEWRGAAAARVIRVVQEVPGAEVAAVAATGLREWLAMRGVEAGVRAWQLPRDVEAPAGELRMQARPPGLAQPRSRMLVWVDLWTDGAFIRSVPVALEVSAGGASLASAERGAAAPLQHGQPQGRPAPAPLLVTRGEWAMLRSSEGMVTLESRVEVLQDGRAGQRIRVRQPGATAAVFARVVGEGRLELAP